MMRALNDLATRINDRTQETKKALLHFLDCCETNPDVSVLCRKSDMVLQNHSDAAHLVVAQARSRAEGQRRQRPDNNKQLD